MKLLKGVLALAVLFFISCNSAPSQKGTVDLKNGAGEEVSIEYSIESEHESFIHVVQTKSQLESIIQQASSVARRSCKHKPTYDPKSLSLTVRNDTVTVFVFFEAKNGFGVPSDEMSVSMFKGSKEL